MNRRELLRGSLVLPLAGVWPGLASAKPLSRVRPGDAAWPSLAHWDELRQRTGGRLIEVRSPLAVCRETPVGADCRTLFKELKNPYFIGDEVGLTQTTGWIDAWNLQESAYAVAAETTSDIVAVVDFARSHNLRLVVKGGGHSYLGTSNAPDSLLIWTRRMYDIEVHEDFVAHGSDSAPQPAVTVGPGAIWMHTYNAVTTKAGRYVQGGGCGTVGVAGLLLGGGFGTYSKTYGTAAAGLLEAEVVTADGMVRTANAATNPDLFWALKGGGGGSFGVVSRMTLRTRDLPATVGIVIATIEARSDAAFRRLLARFLDFYRDSLFTPNWGEIVNVRRENRLEIRLEFRDFDRQQAEALWQPFFASVASSDELNFSLPPRVVAGPARHRWDPEWLKKYAPGAILVDDRSGAPKDNIFWSSNLGEAGHFLHGFESAWLPASLLAAAAQDRLVSALFAASRLWSIELHFQKGMAGAAAETLAAVADTPTNPAVLDAFALAIIAGEGPPAFPDLRGYQPDLAAARRNASAIAQAMVELRKAAPETGSYVAESSYFEPDWQHRYWGKHYSKLLEIKQKYDPDGLFFVRHGVGSEAWSDDGFARLAAR
ncbi:MAG TPA: FAD-binding protein [Stellaceae bacterium]|nr:FAD-binding protein [Stellaceae bacterium]